MISKIIKYGEKQGEQIFYNCFNCGETNEKICLIEIKSKGALIHLCPYCIHDINEFAHAEYVRSRNGH